MPIHTHLIVIREAIDAAVADDSLSRNDLREVLEEVDDHCITILSGLDADDKADAEAAAAEGE